MLTQISPAKIEILFCGFCYSDLHAVRPDIWTVPETLLAGKHRQFERLLRFQKRSQLFIGAHNETLSVAVAIQTLIMH